MAFVLPVENTEIVYFAQDWAEPVPGKREYFPNCWAAWRTRGKNTYQFDDAGHCSEVDWEHGRFEDDNYYDVDNSDLPSYREIHSRLIGLRSDEENRTGATAEVMARFAADLVSNAVAARCWVLTVPPFCHPGSIETMHKMGAKFGKTILFKHGPWLRRVERPWVLPDEVIECCRRGDGSFVQSARFSHHLYTFDANGTAVRSDARVNYRIDYCSVVGDQYDKMNAGDRDITGMRVRALEILQAKLAEEDRRYTGPKNILVRLPPGCSREQIQGLIGSTRCTLLFGQGDWVQLCDGPEGLRQFADCPY